MVSYSPFLFLFYAIDALTAANACIASLEAKLDASRKAWDIATAAKVAAEKTAKSIETKAKKAEKALATADQKRAQRDRTVAERMDKILALFGGKHLSVFWIPGYPSPPAPGPRHQPIFSPGDNLWYKSRRRPSRGGAS
jgi:hypothetical protein